MKERRFPRPKKRGDKGLLEVGVVLPVPTYRVPHHHRFGPVCPFLPPYPEATRANVVFSNASGIKVIPEECGGGVAIGTPYLYGHFLHLRFSGRGAEKAGLPVKRSVKRNRDRDHAHETPKKPCLSAQKGLGV